MSVFIHKSIKNLTPKMSGFDQNPFAEPAVFNPFAVTIFNYFYLYFKLNFNDVVAQEVSVLITLLSENVAIKLITGGIDDIFCAFSDAVSSHFLQLPSHNMFYSIPLQDPAVQQAAGNNAARAQQGLEEYNPFDASQTSKSSVCFFSLFQILIGKNTSGFIVLGPWSKSSPHHPGCSSDTPTTHNDHSRISGWQLEIYCIFIVIIKK